MTKCPYWNDYDSTNGRICFCTLAAFNQPVNQAELETTGCTEDKRRICRADMESVVGFANLPLGIPSDLDPWIIQPKKGDVTVVSD